MQLPTKVLDVPLGNDGLIRYQFPSQHLFLKRHIQSFDLGDVEPEIFNLGIFVLTLPPIIVAHYFLQLLYDQSVDLGRLFLSAVFGSHHIRLSFDTSRINKGVFQLGLAASPSGIGGTAHYFLRPQFILLQGVIVRKGVTHE